MSCNNVYDFFLFADSWRFINARLYNLIVVYRSGVQIGLLLQQSRKEQSRLSTDGKLIALLTYRIYSRITHKASLL